MNTITFDLRFVTYGYEKWFDLDQQQNTNSAIFTRYKLLKTNCFNHALLQAFKLHSNNVFKCLSYLLHLNYLSEETISFFIWNNGYNLKI